MIKKGMSGKMKVPPCGPSDLVNKRRASQSEKTTAGASRCFFGSLQPGGGLTLCFFVFVSQSCGVIYLIYVSLYVFVAGIPMFRVLGLGFWSAAGM